MPPIFGPDGQPLPTSERPPQDLLVQLVKHYDEKAKWPEVEKRFEALLQWLAPQAPLLHGALAGKYALDTRSPEGQHLVRMCVDAAMMALILRQRVVAEVDRMGDENLAGDNGSPPPDPVCEGEDGPRVGEESVDA